MSNNCLAVFIKYPEEAKVKSRLAKTIGNTLAKDLYICFVEDILDRFSNDKFDICICYSPDDKEQEIKEWLGKYYQYQLQEGKDLGEKMKNAFLTLFKNYSNVLIIGSDSPDLPTGYISKSFEQFQTTGSVIGPADDGGYYLIGFNKNNFLPDIFQNIEWSTDSVFKNTMEIFKNNNHNISILDYWYDIDEFKDLERIYKDSTYEFKKSKTFNFIEKNIFNK